MIHRLPPLPTFRIFGVLFVIQNFRRDSFSIARSLLHGSGSAGMKIAGDCFLRRGKTVTKLGTKLGTVSAKIGTKCEFGTQWRYQKRGNFNGRVREWLNRPVSKTGIASGLSRVRIPPLPPNYVPPHSGGTSFGMPTDK
jgi:hypothetical protein